MNPFSRKYRKLRAEVRLAGIEAKIEQYETDRQHLTAWGWQDLAEYKQKAAELCKHIEHLSKP